MVKVVIIDDEQFCVEVIETLIQSHFTSLSIVGLFDDPLIAVEKIPSLHPDLIFLDINMPKLNGFELLDKLMPFSFQVIFTTAYDTYAIKAMKYGALDYLLKPISAEDLKVTLANVIAIGDSKSKIGVHSIPSNKVRKISIVNSDGIIFQSVDEILYCEADNSYTTFYIANGKKIIASKTLKEFETVLQNESFYRVHNSFLVNLNHVDMYVKADGGSVVVHGQKLPISRTKKEEFIDLIQKFHKG